MPDNENETEMQCERCGNSVADSETDCADCQMQGQDDEMSAR